MLPWTNPFSGQQSSNPGPSGSGGNPFAPPGSGGGKKDKQPPEPTTAQSFIDPAVLRSTWNYKTAQTGMFGEALPENAEGWTPYGTPYFGKGLSGKLREYQWMFTRNTDAPTGDEWDALKGKYKELNQSQTGYMRDVEAGKIEADPSRTGENIKAAGGLALESVKLAWQAGTSDGSIVSPVLRTLGVALKGIGDLFSIPSQVVEKVSGAVSGVGETAKELGIDLPEFMPDTDHWFVRYVNEQSVIINGYAAIKIALSPRKDKWDVFNENVKEGWDAGKIYYSGVYDKSIREEYLRRLRAGENPEILAMELENPIAEMAGQLVLDPLNPIGMLSKAKTVDKVLDASRAAVTASGTLGDVRAGEILDDISKLGKSDDVKAAKLFDEFTSIHTEAVRAVETSKLTQEYKFTSLAASSNRNVVTREAQNFIGLINSVAKGSGRGADEVAEFIRAGVLSVSNNADEARAGVSGLMHFDAPKLMFSESGIKTFTMIRRMMETEDGILDTSRLLRLTKLEDTQEFMDAATDLIVAGAKTSFPTVDEMADAYKLQQAGEVGKATSDLAEQFKRLPKHVLAANFLNSKAQVVYSPLNRVLGTFYFSLQGGVAVKNILANTIQIFIDQGPRAFIRDMEFTRIVDGKEEIFRRPAFWSAKKIEADLEKMLGFKSSLASGFETQAKDAKAVETIFSKMMSAGETNAASRVVWSSMKDSMRKLMDPRYLGDTTPLLDAGLSEGQANHLMRLFYDHAGDTEKVMQEFRNTYGKGSVETWRTLDFLPKHYEDGFHDLDIYDEISDFARNGGKSIEEVESFFKQLKDGIVARGAAAAQDGARITQETPGFEAMQKLEDALANGSLTDNAGNEVLRTWLVASNEAKHEYMEALQDLVDWGNRNLPGSQGVQFSNRMKQLRKAEQLGLQEAETRALEKIDSARAWSQEIRDLKNPTPEVLKTYWTQAGIPGAPPADLTKQQLQNKLWFHFRDEKGAIWQEHYGLIFQESRSIVEELGKVTDITPLKQKLTRAEMSVERANQLRSAIYRKGTFYTSPGKRDVFSLANMFGVPTASASGKPNDKMLLNIINKYNGTADLPKTGDALQSVDILNDIPEGSPLSIIKEHGGMSADEFSDVMGGKLGTDKQGVLPGLFTKKGKGVDDVGRLLAEFGFITEREAEDVNFVREFIRKTADKRGSPSSKSFVQYFDEADGANDLPHYDDAGNLVMPKRANQKFTKVEEVPGDVALEAFEKWSAAKGGKRPDVSQLQSAMVPAYPSGSMPSVARSWNENTRPALYALDKTKEAILSRFGEKVAAGIDPAAEKALVQYVKGTAPKIAEGKAIALKAAEHWRDFILHNYGAKTYGDLTFAYAMPYKLWYSRTYTNWMKRIASDPHIIAGYSKYKQNMEKLNRDHPEFYKGQIEINGIFGIDFDHPLIFNLEAAINPLNGITGVDFNDADRRVNWWTASLDDMNKFGPTMFAPLQWGIATALSMQGEDDAAQAWAGRAIPETAVYKSLANYVAKGDWTEAAPVDLPSTNIIPGLKYGELDPIVNLFSGGLDKYERGRVGNALSQMVESGQITQEQAIDATQEQKGPIWDSAVAAASAGRLGTNAVSWLAGVGFKPRTETDKEIESMFSELNILRTLNKDGRMTPEQYRQSMDVMREKYKFMDAVVLSRRGGEFRDSAFAYNVLGRLPPGVSYDVLSSVGLTDKDINKFYDSKGFTDKSVAFSQSEKDRFMLAVTDLAAMLEMPDYATRTEWNEARSQYKLLSDGIAETFGDDIWDKVSAYYDMRDVNPDLATKFKEQHPEITQALQMRQEGVVNDPTLFEYYGGIDKLEAYFDGKVRQTLLERYGDTAPLWAQYYDLKLQGKTSEAKQFWRSHPQLKGYVEDKPKLMEEANRAFVEFASRLPEGNEIDIRDDFTPQTGQQEQLLEAMQPERIPSWGDIKGAVGNDISPAMETLLNAYVSSGAPLSPAAKKQLDYVTSRYGSQFGVAPNDPDSMLRIISVAMTRGQGQGGALSQSTQWSNPFGR